MRGPHIRAADQTGNPIQLCDLDSFPEYAQRVGAIVSLWSIIELRLSVVFGSLLRCPPWTAWQAYFSTFNQRARTDMVRALAMALDHRLPERDELIALVERIRRAPAARHGYAHRPWMTDGKRLFQMEMPAVPIEKSTKHRVTTKQLDNDFVFLQKLNDDLWEFQQRFQNKYLTPIEILVSREPQTPWPGKWPEHIPRPKKQRDRRTP
jgi:hypothetical protein